MIFKMPSIFDINIYIYLKLPRNVFLVIFENYFFYDSSMASIFFEILNYFLMTESLKRKITQKGLRFV